MTGSIAEFRNAAPRDVMGRAAILPVELTPGVMLWLDGTGCEREATLKIGAALAVRPPP